MRIIPSICLLLVLLSSSVLAQTKSADWKTGKLISSENVDRYGMPAYGRGGTTSFTIEADDFIYVVTRSIAFKWTTEIHLTINDPVQYTVEKNNLYLIDENGKKFKLRIEKKIRRS